MVMSDTLTEMELASVTLSQSPRHPYWLRVTGTVTYDDAPNLPEEYWFEVDSSYADQINLSGDPWLACLLPVAVTLGEPLRICKPVDALLLENAEELMRLWKCWYRHLNVIAIDAKPAESPFVGGNRTAAFFSGGVDSFFTVLRREDTSAYPHLTAVDDLIVVHGFDVAVNDPTACERFGASLDKAARSLRKVLVEVATNMRACRFSEADWGSLAHGAALASVALLLGGRFGRAFIASSNCYDYLPAWGTHPISDPLYSASYLSLAHDAAFADRVEKTTYVAGSEIVREALHVCYHWPDARNCCKCSKCYRTMTALECLGQLESYKTFDQAPFTIEHLSRFLWSDDDIYEFQLNLRLAESQGRQDIARAITTSIRRTQRVRRLLHWIWRLRRFRVLSGLADLLESRLLGGMVLD